MSAIKRVTFKILAVFLMFYGVLILMNPKQYSLGLSFEFSILVVIGLYIVSVLILWKLDYSKNKMSAS